jgi:hypothetical protein
MLKNAKLRKIIFLQKYAEKREIKAKKILQKYAEKREITQNCPPSKNLTHFFRVFRRQLLIRKKKMRRSL